MAEWPDGADFHTSYTPSYATWMNFPSLDGSDSKVDDYGKEGQVTGEEQDDAMTDDDNLASKAGHLHGNIKNINIRRTDTNDVLTLKKDHPDIQDWNGLLRAVSNMFSRTDHERMSELATFNGDLLTPKNYPKFLASSSDLHMIASFEETRSEKNITDVSWMRKSHIEGHDSATQAVSMLIGPHLSFSSTSNEQTPQHFAISVAMKYLSRLRNVQLLPHEDNMIRGPWTPKYGTQEYLAEQRALIREFSINLDLEVSRHSTVGYPQLTNMNTGQATPNWWISWQEKPSNTPEVGTELEPCWWISEQLEQTAKIKPPADSCFLLQRSQVVDFLSRVMMEAGYCEEEVTLMANTIRPYIKLDLPTPPPKKSIDSTVFLLQFLPASSIRKILELGINPYPIKFLRLLFILRATTVRECISAKTIAQGDVATVLEQIRGGSHNRVQNGEGIKVMEWGGILLPRAGEFLTHLAEAVPVSREQQEMQQFGTSFTQNVSLPEA